MTKRWIAGLLALAMLACTGPAPVQAGAVKENMDSAGQTIGKGLEPVGEDINYLGRSLFYGIGAIIAIPLRFVQGVFNAVSQGVANEKLWDHTH